LGGWTFCDTYADTRGYNFLTLNMKELWYLEMHGITEAVTRRHVPDDPNNEN